MKEVVSNITNESWIKYIVFCVYIILVFSIESYYRNPLYNFSLKAIPNVQNALGEGGLTFFELITKLGKFEAFFVLICLVYNFLNSYKTLVMIFVLQINTFLRNFLIIIYHQQRPFMDNEKIKVIGCNGSYGNPSGHCLHSTAFYLSLWYVFFSCEEMKGKRSLKTYSLIFFILLVLLIIFSRIALGVHSINQIVFGTSLGLGVFIFFFYVLEIDLNSPDGIYFLVSIPTKYYALINCLLFALCLLVYYLIDPDINPKWIEVISKSCSKLEENSMFKVPGLFGIASCFSYIGAIIGLKYEYYFLTDENKTTFRSFNFEKNIATTKMTLLAAISVTEDTQWNHTGLTKSFLRFVAFVALSAVTLILYMVISKDTNIYVVMIFKIFVPMTLWMFGMFFVFKFIFMKVNLINNSMLPLDSKTKLNLANVLLQV